MNRVRLHGGGSGSGRVTQLLARLWWKLIRPMGLGGDLMQSGVYGCHMRAMRRRLDDQERQKSRLLDSCDPNRFLTPSPKSPFGRTQAGL